MSHINVIRGPVQKRPIGAVLNFSGTHTPMPIGIPAEITTNLTLECWALRSSTGIGESHRLVEKPHTSHADPYYMYGLIIGSDGVFGADLATGDGFERLNGGAAISDNIWYHVAMTYDGSTLTLYLNGTSVNTRAETGAIESNGTTNLYLGSHGNVASEKLYGKLSNIRLWNVARSAPDILANMKLSIRSETGLVGSWLCDEPVGATTLPDATGNLSAASLTAGVTFNDVFPYPFSTT